MYDAQPFGHSRSEMPLFYVVTDGIRRRVMTTLPVGSVVTQTGLGRQDTHYFGRVSHDAPFGQGEIVRASYAELARVSIEEIRAALELPTDETRVETICAQLLGTVVGSSITACRLQ